MHHLSGTIVYSAIYKRSNQCKDKLPIMLFMITDNLIVPRDNSSVTTMLHKLEWEPL